MKNVKENLAAFNRIYRNWLPEDIVRNILQYSERPVLTTNFGPNSITLIDVVMRMMPEIPVIWVDTGFNTPETYTFIRKVSLHYRMNLHQFKGESPFYSEIPDVDSEDHKLFTQKVKIEPFQQAMAQFNPDLWLTNLRKGQTKHRDSLDVLHLSKQGIIKASPFYYYNEQAINNYITSNNLPNETNYFDPTKVLQHRECGIHL